MTGSDTEGPNWILMYLALDEHFLLTSPLLALSSVTFMWQKVLTTQILESTNFFWVKAPNDKPVLNFKQLKTFYQTCFKLEAGASSLVELGITHPQMNYY